MLSDMHPVNVGGNNNTLMIIITFGSDKISRRDNLCLSLQQKVVFHKLSGSESLQSIQRALLEKFESILTES